MNTRKKRIIIQHPRTIAYLERVLANPKPGVWRTLKAPSDPAFAFAAIYSHVAGMDKTTK